MTEAIEDDTRHSIECARISGPIGADFCSCGAEAR